MSDPKPVTPISAEDLARLDAIEKAATPGPWAADGLFVGQAADFYQRLVLLAERSMELEDECGSEDAYDEQRKANVKLAAELRNAYLPIRATIAQQAQRIEELERELAEVRKGYADSIEARSQRLGYPTDSLEKP